MKRYRIKKIDTVIMVCRKENIDRIDIGEYRIFTFNIEKT